MAPLPTLILLPNNVAWCYPACQRLQARWRQGGADSPRSRKGQHALDLCYPCNRFSLVL